MFKQRKDYFLTNLCFAILGICAVPKSHAAFNDVESMLNAMRPTAAAYPEINDVITALDALPTDARQRALSTLTPVTDLSILAASESANRQMVKRLNQRMIAILSPQTGVSVGDEWDDIFAEEENKPKATKTESKADSQAKNDNDTDSLEAVDDDNAIDEQYQFSFISKKQVMEHKKDPNKGLWMLALGSEARQKDQDNVHYGYKATVLGAIIGKDWVYKDRWVWGLAGGFQRAEADSKGPAGSQMDTKRFQASLYGYYTCPSSFYALGLLTGAQNRYDSKRKIVIPAAGGVPNVFRSAHADFNGWETHAHLEIGKTWYKGNGYATPKLFTNYTHWNIESYQEHDAYGLNLNVRSNNIDSFVLGGGLDLEYRNHFNNAVVIPYLQVYVLHDFINDKQVTTSNMLGGGFDFMTESAKPKGTTLEAGTGINVRSYKNFIFDLHYDFAVRSKYTRHTVGLKLRYEWA